MTEEQMQNTIQFIIEQQSRLVGDMQVTQEAMQAMQEHSRLADDRLRTLTDALLSLTHIIEENAKQTDQRFRETDQKIARLAELGEGTEARLNAFITFVENYIQSRDGGRA
jgi:tRNA U34 5-methylaminomethyl-2-thiouridine-forming methyltransferase MnmC